MLISVENLTRSYHLGGETVTALAGVSLQIAMGECVAVMGPSGSGKSTFMNVIGCIDKPNSGRYILAGEEVSNLNAVELAAIRNRRIGFVFQQFNLLQRSDAQANVALPLLYAGLPRATRLKKAAEALEKVGLANRMHHRPLQLSGGQQQRVAIARALVNTPSVLLADEPTGALDSQTALEIMALFQSLNREGMTVILVTHEVEVARFASRLIRFRDGKILSDARQTPFDAAKMLAENNASQEAPHAQELQSLHDQPATSRTGAAHAPH